MPILPAEPDLLPSDLWDRFAELSPPLRWWCLHTKPRQEKVTARHLLARGLSFYLPQVRVTSRTPSGRKIASIQPLFPGYVFLLGNDQHRLDVYQAGTLVNILDVLDQQGLTRDLHQVFQVLASGVPVELEPTYPVGVGVRIVEGPLTGIRGTVLRRDARDRFVALVEFLGRGVAVDLEDWQVERTE